MDNSADPTNFRKPFFNIGDIPKRKLRRVSNFNREHTSSEKAQSSSIHLCKTMEHSRAKARAKQTEPVMLPPLDLSRLSLLISTNPIRNVLVLFQSF